MKSVNRFLKALSRPHNEKRSLRLQKKCRTWRKVIVLDNKNIQTITSLHLVRRHQSQKELSTSDTHAGLLGSRDAHIWVLFLLPGNLDFNTAHL